jgi:hypothetical protein
MAVQDLHLMASSGTAAAVVAQERRVKRALILKRGLEEMVLAPALQALLSFTLVAAAAADLLALMLPGVLAVEETEHLVGLGAGPGLRELQTGVAVAAAVTLATVMVAQAVPE